MPSNHAFNRHSVKLKTAAKLTQAKYGASSQPASFERRKNDAIVAAIGPAGEKLSRMACVMFEGQYARAAGRTGMGAVMPIGNDFETYWRNLRAERGRSVGLIVAQIVDIVSERIDIQRRVSRPGVLGSVVLQQRVTDLIDIAAVVAFGVQRLTAPNIGGGVVGSGGDRRFEIGTGDEIAIACGYAAILGTDAR